MASSRILPSNFVWFMEKEISSMNNSTNTMNTPANTYSNVLATSSHLIANNSFLNHCTSKKLTVEDLDIEVEYLMNEFLVKESLNMIYASAGQGKSYIVLSIAVTLLLEGKIKKCLYFDMDNGTIALKSRGLDTLIAQHDSLQYIHHSKIDMQGSVILEKLALEANTEHKSLEDYLIVFDSIRDFVGGRDMNSDKEIMPVLNSLKKLREAGATVVFLHHAKKDSDGRKEVYKGSTSFIDSTDVAYLLQSEKKNQKTLSYSLTVMKDRLPVADSAFLLDTKTFSLTQQNYDFNRLTDAQRQMIKEVEAVLNNHQNGINQTNLLKAINKTNDDKTARKYLKQFSGQFWKSKVNPETKNSLNYFPIAKAS